MCFAVHDISLSVLLNKFAISLLINKANKKMKKGEVCLIENIRFQKNEEKIDLNFAKNVSSLFDVSIGF